MIILFTRWGVQKANAIMGRFWDRVRMVGPPGNRKGIMKTLGPYKATIVKNDGDNEIKAIIVEMNGIVSVMRGPIEFDYGTDSEEDAIEYIKNEPDVDYQQSEIPEENTVKISQTVAVIEFP